MNRTIAFAFVIVGVGFGAVAALAFMLPSPLADFSESWVNAFNSIFAALLSGGVAFLSAYWLWRREISTADMQRRLAQLELGRTAGMMIATPTAGLEVIAHLLKKHGGTPSADGDIDFPQSEISQLRDYLDALKNSSEDAKRNLERLSSTFSEMEAERIMWFTYAELQIDRCIELAKASGFASASVSTAGPNAGTVILNGAFIEWMNSLRARLLVSHRELVAENPSLEAIEEFQSDDAKAMIADVLSD